MSVLTGKTIAEILEGQLKACGEEILVFVSEATLEAVGEAMMIATDGELDCKTIGKACLQQTVRILLAPLKIPASSIIVS